jgi:radical SAM superfamily enzyme YgiQ (UPF0313 family)
MKITLIKPKMGQKTTTTYREKAVMEPLALAIIAALTPSDVEVVLYDDRIEPIPYDEPTDLVAITVITFTAKRAYEISKQYKKRGVPVVLGGYHPSLDSVCIGEAEDLWPTIVTDAKSGKLKPFYRGNFNSPRSNLIPRRNIFKGKSYLPITLIRFSRGCVYKCNFCTVSSFYHRKFYHRPIEEVINEIEAQDRKTILFVDDNIVMNHRLSKEFFRQLIPLKIRWFSEANISMAHDLELMDLMSKSGCAGLLIGFESIERNSLRSMDKAPNLVNFDRYKSQLEIIRNYGLLIWAAFTLGHEYDTKETIDKTLEFSLNHKFTLADYNVLMPYPGTPLYEMLAEKGRLFFNGKWWLHSDYRFGDAAFRPNRMSAEELSEGCYKARLEFYSFKSILRRAFDLKMNMRSFFHFIIYHVSNYLSYNDTIKKQGVALGDTSL